MKSLKKYVKKIVDSGWDGYFLIVCSVIEKGSDPFNESVILGWMGRIDEEEAGFYLKFGDPKKRYWRKPRKIAVDEFATLTKCDKCKSYTFFDLTQGWTCKYCGYHDKSIYRNASDISFNSIEKMWMECKNKVQWKSKSRVKKYTLSRRK